MGARLYDPAIGRFLSRDPLLIPRTAATTNPYAFVSNDPVNRSDPTGLLYSDDGEQDSPPSNPGGAGGGAGTPIDVNGETIEVDGGTWRGFVQVNIGLILPIDFHAAAVEAAAVVAQPSVVETFSLGTNNANSAGTAASVDPWAQPLRVDGTECAPAIGCWTGEGLVKLNRDFPGTHYTDSIIDWIADYFTDGFVKMTSGIFDTYGVPHPSHAFAVAEFRPTFHTGAAVTVHIFLNLLLLALGPEGEAAVGSSTAEGSGNATYEILNGVRRAKAAEIAGHTGIEAEIEVGGRTVGRQTLPLDALRSPKEAISTAGSGLDRWLDTLGKTLSGSKPPAIRVTPGTRGTPIPDVQIE